jgi:hypothetical protein
MYILAALETSPLVLRLFIGLLYQPWMIYDNGCGAISEIYDKQVNRCTMRNVPIAVLANSEVYCSTITSDGERRCCPRVP